MSIIVWDGKSLAADKQSTHVGLRSTVSKIRRLQSGEVVAWCGTNDGGLLMAHLYERGQLIEKWPEFQKDKDDFVMFIVASHAGLVFYERNPIAQRYEQQYAAFGSGRDYAMGALAMGADARRAVEVACQFDNGCGCGIDVLEPL